MAKKSSAGESELNLDSLMDAVTNVVGVLMIVFVMMALNTARVVQKILSDLPPVTPEQHQEMLEQVKALPPPPADPKKLEEDKQKTEDALKKAIEQLKTVDTTELQSRMKFMDLEAFRQKLEEAKKQRDTQKVEVDKLLTEVERLKALLDQTPIPQTLPPTYVRLPNPRPFPEKANETRIMVAKQGILIVSDKAILDPVLTGLEKIKSQLEYKEVKIDPFAKLLQGVFGSAAAAQQAWPDIAPLVSTFQMEQVAQAYKVLADAKLAPNRAMLQALGDISIVTRSSLPVLATAVVAATQGDFSKWTALDPSRDPTKPTITATAAGGKVTLTWGSNKVEVKQNPRDVLNYFIKDLADMNNIKNRSRDKVIYDAFKIQQTLERAATSPTLASGAFTIQPAVRPGSTAVQVALVPKAGAGETLEQMRGEGSNFQRQLRQVKGDPNGVAIFQVMPDGFTTYLEARKIADEIGVPATWEFLARLDITINVPGYEVQRFTPVPPPTPPGTQPGVRIAPPKRKLD
jgi:hypothetical protein